MTDTDKPNEQPATMSKLGRPGERVRGAQAGDPSRKPGSHLRRARTQRHRGRHHDFDGYGDSGQIGEISVTAGTEHDLAAIEIEQKRADWHTDAIETVTVALRTAIEDIGYELLEKTHCGWMNNEGGFGEFVFDVPARTITLDFNQRYAGCESYAHEF